MPRRSTVGSNRATVKQEPRNPDAVDLASPNKVEVGETKNGRTLVVERTRCGRFFTIKIKEGGELAQDLSGIFTSYENAQWALTQYKQRKNIVD